MSTLSNRSLLRSDHLLLLTADYVLLQMSDSPSLLETLAEQLEQLPTRNEMRTIVYLLETQLKEAASRLAAISG